MAVAAVAAAAASEAVELAETEGESTLEGTSVSSTGARAGAVAVCTPCSEDWGGV